LTGKGMTWFETKEKDHKYYAHTLHYRIKIWWLEWQNNRHNYHTFQPLLYQVVTSLLGQREFF
jgi:hypothetical protein